MLQREQKEAIKAYAPVYEAYRRSEQWKRDEEKIRVMVEYFSNLSEDTVKSMTADELETLLASTWSIGFWKQLGWIRKKLINLPGEQTLKRALVDLLFGLDSPWQRFERFINEIKFAGPSLTSELLSWRYPKECAILTNRTYKAMSKLKIDKIARIPRGIVSGEDYKRISEIMVAVGNELERLGFGPHNLPQVNCFIYEVDTSSPPSSEPPVTGDWSHNEVQKLLIEIGAWLGFEADPEGTVSHGAKVDVVWTAKIGNLGVVKYIFEIQHRGSIDSLLMNLLKATKNPTVQKVVVVTSEEQIEKIRKESFGLPESFREKMAFWEVGDLIKVHEKLETAFNSVNSLGLVRDEFPYPSSTQL